MTKAKPCALSASELDRQVRLKTHGDFGEHARISQEVKAVIDENDFEKLTAVQREALDMIATKIGAILAGDPNHARHWEDIAGYATLTSQRIGAA